MAIFAVLFGMAFSFVLSDVRRLMFRLKAKILGLARQLLFLPSVACALALLFGIPAFNACAIHPGVMHFLESSTHSIFSESHFSRTRSDLRK